MVMSADAYLGGMSGLGGGVADQIPRGNLSMLVWTPIGNKAWQPAIDDNALCLYGPDGVILYNQSQSVILNLSGSSVAVTAPALSTTGNVVVGTGASGTFTTPTGQTVTVQDGIVTNIY
jgi:hypothetical protein